MVQAAIVLYLLAKNLGAVNLSFMFAFMASFVAKKICGLKKMVGNIFTGQFQNFEPDFFTNSRSYHGFAFVKQ